MIFMRMLERRLRLSLGWECNVIRHCWALRLVLCAGLTLALSAVGCTDYSRANANIAFMGDSITAHWYLPRSNLGIPGNTTTDMVARFPAEVPGHGYKAIVILGGTNDVRIKSQPIEDEVGIAIGNLTKMAEQSKALNLSVVLCSIPPIQGEEARSETLNAEIKKLAEANHYGFVDYYTPMAGHPEYFVDMLHPNAEGYAVMQEALTQVIPLDY